MLRVPSFAKINLYLRVLEKEPGGYHRIETVLQTVSLHDIMYFERLREPRVEVTADDAPGGEANIAYRAAALMVPKGRGVRIRIEKKIPIGAGLGGGSSNAAMTLLALNHLFDAGYSLAALAHLGGRLGSDVPFFLAGGTACGFHHGERVVPLPDLPPAPVTLLYPGVQMLSARAYANLKLTKEMPDATIENFCYSLLNQRVDQLSTILRNDFERTVLKDKRIVEARKFLTGQGFGKVHLSGSGSTLFALGRPKRKLRVGAGWKFWQAHLLTRSQYRKRLSRCLRWPEH
ncbi:MAG TPA: 4-(cytidine 5'-diphospho)-2-C-methyl-D-erythritol kinase [Acidobacteriota bacterium]|jgi:4-diphosphocytidyl-2-C-methyl-D-erythritol kinase